MKRILQLLGIEIYVSSNTKNGSTNWRVILRYSALILAGIVPQSEQGGYFECQGVYKVAHRGQLFREHTTTTVNAVSRGRQSSKPECLLGEAWR